MSHGFGLRCFQARGGLKKLLQSCPVQVHGVSPSQSPVDIFKKISLQTPGYIINLKETLSRIELWSQLLPRVHPYYAYKCNNDPVICKMLVQAGAGMDCASLSEIQDCINFGVPASDIIYANTQKEPGMLYAADLLGVSLTTVDSPHEILKIRNHAACIKVLLRIAVDDEGALCRFSSKFGAFAQEWPEIFETAKANKINLVGVSFHTGSGASGPKAFENAIHQARVAFNVGAAFGFDMNILDIGGGFPGSDNEMFSFACIANAINSSLHIHFNNESIRVIAEPGRFFVEDSHVYALSVIGARELAAQHLKDANTIELGHKSEMQQATRALFLNDGLYGCFNNIVFDHHKLDIVGYSYKDSRERDRALQNTKLFGPTCDSIDVIKSDILVPPLQIGDSILFRRMGAYTRSASSVFNGFGKYQLAYVVDNAEMP